MLKQLTAQQFFLFPKFSHSNLEDFIRVCTLVSFYHNTTLEVKKSEVKDNIESLFATYKVPVTIRNADIDKVFNQLKLEGYLQPRKKGSNYWSLVQGVLPFSYWR